MIPTEHEATIALDAATRVHWRRQQALSAAAGHQYPDFDDLERGDQNAVLSELLPMVWAALEAIPDRRHHAWAVGHAAGVADATSVPFGETYRITENPFPADPAWRPRTPNAVEEDWLVRNTDWTPDDDPDEYLASAARPPLADDPVREDLRQLAIDSPVWFGAEKLCWREHAPGKVCVLPDHHPRGARP